jgi:hypothetical protein
LSIRRAYPSFKIFFIEEDASETHVSGTRKIRAFDDLYSYSSVQEIKIVRSRHCAGDLATIRITNVGGSILRKRYSDPGADMSNFNSYLRGNHSSVFGVDAEYATGLLAETEAENPFGKIVLQNGVKIEIRLGYSGSADGLENVFLGQVIEMSPSEDGKIIEILCQGYGAELEATELGSDSSDISSTYTSSQEALCAAILNPTIVNFGRQSNYAKFFPGEARINRTGGLGNNLTDTLYDSIFGKFASRAIWRNLYSYSFKQEPQDDNIFAPPPHLYTSLWERWLNNSCLYRPIRQTAWEIFKEHELRHPGYISLAVPYGYNPSEGDSPRMTMFFGAKGQFYWSRSPTAQEVAVAKLVSDQVILGRSLLGDAGNFSAQDKEKIEALYKDNPELAEAIKADLLTKGIPVNTSRALGSIYGRYIPFRNYHFFDSEHHLIKNNIKTNTSGVFNKIEVLYFPDEGKLEEFGKSDMEEYVEELQNKEEGVFSQKLDANIPDELINSYTEGFPSCVGEHMASRYAQGLFARHLRDGYKGEFIVLGEPTLKPYDICYIADYSINMMGPVEVESVTHIFNRDYGFISIVTPDMCVDINEYYSATVMDLMAAGLSNLYNTASSLSGAVFGTMAAGAALTTGAAVAAANTLPSLGVGTVGTLAVGGASIFGSAAVTTFLGVGALSLFGSAAAIKLMQWTEGGAPVLTTPLMLQGQPFTSVNISYRNSSLFSTYMGLWDQWWDDAERGWDDANVSEEFTSALHDAKMWVVESFALGHAQDHYTESADGE